jgi:hypothetical protein
MAKPNETFIAPARGTQFVCAYGLAEIDLHVCGLRLKEVQLSYSIILFGLHSDLIMRFCHNDE